MTDQIPDKLLITGASSGVGKSLADYFSDRFHVIVAARRKERLEDYFGKREQFSVYQVDLGNPIDVALFSDKIVAEHGYIPYLINNAGVNSRGKIEDLAMDTVLHSVRVNALSPLFLMKKLLPAMRQYNFGRIINVTSGAPLNCFQGFGAYSASKGFLNALTVTAAREQEGYNIKINLMSPGPVRSEMAPDSDLDPDICHPTADHLISLDEDGPTGGFYWLGYEVPLFPDLEGIKWLEGDAGGKLKKVFE